MFKLKNNLLYILLFGLLCITMQGAYSYDIYGGRVKYGTYHCVKDGETCNFERYEGGGQISGKACPPYDKNMKFEDRNEIMADFLNSQYCKFTPTNVKKYECRYDDGRASVYLKEGKVISANHSTTVERKNIQDFYIPNKCTERKMEGDNGEPPLKKHSINNSSNNIPQDGNNSFNNISDDKYQTEYLKTSLEQSIKKETESLNEQIISLQNQIEPLKNEINTLKEQNHKLETYFHYMLGFIGIIFVIALIALSKSNNNPYKRL